MRQTVSQGLIKASQIYPLIYECILQMVSVHVVVSKPAAPGRPPFGPMPSGGIYLSSLAVACHHTRYLVYLVSEQEGSSYISQCHAFK